MEAGAEELGECVKDAQMGRILELLRPLLYSYDCSTPCLYILTQQVPECCLTSYLPCIRFLFLACA